VRPQYDEIVSMDSIREIYDITKILINEKCMTEIIVKG